MPMKFETRSSLKKIWIYSMVLLPDPRQLKTLLTAIMRQQGSRHTPKCRNNTTPPQRSPTNQNNGSMILIFSPWLVKACPTCSRSLDLASAHLRQKSKCTTGSLHATTISRQEQPHYHWTRDRGSHGILQTTQQCKWLPEDVGLGRRTDLHPAKKKLMTISYPNIKKQEKDSVEYDWPI